MGCLLKLLLNFYTLHMVRIWNMYFQKLIVKVIEISSPDHSWPYHGPGSYSPLVSKCVICILKQIILLHYKPKHFQNYMYGK